jgi:hypothetical protein
MGIGAVLLDHLVVDPEQKEWGDPLSNEQGMMVFAGGFEDERAGNESKGRTKGKAGGQFGGVAPRKPAELSSRFCGS